MADRPILFNGPMVRAIIDGRKTQTRRVISSGSYSIGDRLWVRESFTVEPGFVLYRAGDYDVVCKMHAFDHPTQPSGIKWKPSIHMPRWASRLALVVTDVRVQRLQEISEEDALAEGLVLGEPLPFLPDRYNNGPVWHDGVTDPIDGWTRDPREAFMRLWSASCPHIKLANPFVSALTFEAHRCNIDQMEREL